jgi:hypothetical protein
MDWLRGTVHGCLWVIFFYCLGISVSKMRVGKVATSTGIRDDDDSRISNAHLHSSMD